MSNLPKGWKQTVLGEVIKIKNGYAFSTSDYQKSGVPLIRQSNLNHDTVDLDRCVYLDENFLISKSSFILMKNDVLIGMSGSIGKLCIYDLDYPALQNQRTGKVEIISDSNIDKKFIWRYLCTIESQLKEKGRGLGISNVSAKDIENLPLTLPPLGEQKRIVERLELLLNKINNSKERLKKIPAILKRFRQSVLSSACSGRLTADWREENGCEVWESKKLGDIVGKRGIFDGPFGSELKTSDYVDKGVRVVRLENVGALNFIKEKENYISEEKYQKLLKHTVYEGDIIFSSFIADCVRVCLIPRLDTKTIAKADCFCIRPNSEIVLSTYLCYALSNPDIFDEFNALAHGATRPRINTTQLKSIKVSIPSISEQQEIMRRVDKLFALADKIEQRYKNAKVQLERAEKAFYAKAFRGELVRYEE